MRTNSMNGVERPYYKKTPLMVYIFLTAIIFLSLVNDAHATDSCHPAMARVVSVQGVIELRRAGKIDWEPAIMNTVLCAGDRIRTRAHSRAALRLSNESMLRLNQRTTVTFPKIQTDESRSLLDLLNGVIHIITRTPIPFKVRTPFVNANVEGTEFLVNVSDDNTRLVVFEGQVRASNDQGSLSLVDNEAAVTYKDQVPQKEVIIRPTDAVQWALHYPTIIDDSLDPPSQNEQSTNFLIHRAGHLLTVGRVDEATISIEQALTLEPDNSKAYALKAIIAVVQNDKDQALIFATQAVELDPTSATAKLALSYAQQAHFEIEDALATVHEAVKLDSQNALAWARLAELQMSAGYLDRALDAAQQAVRLNPDIAKTRTVLGFAYLLQINTEDAKTVFNQAILLDQADPMPRLGLGLALIREGELEAGRIELEIAASLDPANSLIRSYLGKAYFEEKRYPLASTQFDLAKERDPFDPTPWFYDAIQKQTQNRPVEALQDIQKSIELNDNRAVYRSKLLLDQDQAGRGSSLARIFDNLGFDKRARVETAKSLSIDPSNHSAHRFLSDTYASTPRHEIARVSELLQAQLLQPINVNPVQPHLAAADLNIITGTGPSTASFNEFAPLMERNKPQLVTSGIAGNQGTLGNEMVFSTLHNRTSVSLGQFHYETNGFRKNNDQKHNIYNAFIQHAFSPKLNVQAEIKTRETEHGDIELNFNPRFFSEREKIKFKEDSARLGARYSISPRQDIIVSTTYVSRRSNNVKQPNPLDSSISEAAKNRRYQIETQYLLREDYYNMILGGGLSRRNGDSAINNQGNIHASSASSEHNYAYIYSNWKLPKNFTPTLGLNYQFYKLSNSSETKNELNPKFGLQWNIVDKLRLRLAWFETVKADLVGQQTIESTQVAGFNQFFDDPTGTKSRRKGIGLDSNISNNFFGGIEASVRELRVPFLGSSNIEKQKEQVYSGYFYGLLNPYWSFRGELQFEKFSRNENPIVNGITPNIIETLSIPLKINYFNPNGLFAALSGTFVNQNLIRLSKENLSTPGLSSPSNLKIAGKSNFFLLDTFFGYRMPSRKGLLSFEVKNLLNKSFYFKNQQFFVSEPLAPRFSPSRTFFVRLTLNF